MLSGRIVLLFVIFMNTIISVSLAIYHRVLQLVVASIISIYACRLLQGIVCNMPQLITLIADNSTDLRNSSIFILVATNDHTLCKDQC